MLLSSEIDVRGGRGKEEVVISLDFRYSSSPPSYFVRVKRVIHFEGDHFSRISFSLPFILIIFRFESRVKDENRNRTV